MHDVPLNRYALEIIEEVAPFTNASPYIFRTTRALSPQKHQKADLFLWVNQPCRTPFTEAERDVTGEVYVQYSYDFEKQKAAQVWEFILDQIVSCASPKDIPTLEELREWVKKSGLL